MHNTGASSIDDASMRNIYFTSMPPQSKNSEVMNAKVVLICSEWVVFDAHTVRSPRTYVVTW